SDKQAKKDSVVAWARPTLESTEQKGKLTEIAADFSVVTIQTGNVITDYHLLPRTRDQVQKDDLKRGDDVVISYYESGHKRMGTFVRRGQKELPFTDDITVRVNSEAVEVGPGETRKHEFLLYHGPTKVRLLDQFRGDKAVPEELVDRYADTLNLKYLTD